MTLTTTYSSLALECEGVLILYVESYNILHNFIRCHHVSIYHREGISCVVYGLVRM